MNTKQEALQTIDLIITDLENIESECFLKKIDSTMYRMVIDKGIELMGIFNDQEDIKPIGELALAFYIQETNNLKFDSFNLRFLKLDYEKQKN